MAKAPAFQFYPGDWLLKTKGMSAAARGCYIDMLATSWAIGPIKDTPRDLVAAMSLSPFDPSFESIWGEIKPKWDLGPNGWTNEKLEAVRAEQEAYRQRQSDKGKKSAANRANSTELKPESNHGSTVVQPAYQPEGQPDTQPESNPSSSPLTFDLDLRSSSSPLPSRSTEELAPPAEIAAIMAIAPFDRTPDQSETLHAYRGGPELLPRGSKPVRTRTGADPKMRQHHACPGTGTWVSCAKGICVPRKLYEQWTAQVSGTELDPHGYVAAFVSNALKDFSGAIGDNDFDFWRAAWKHAHGSVLAAVSRGGDFDDKVLAILEQRGVAR